MLKKPILTNQQTHHSLTIPLDRKKLLKTLKQKNKHKTQSINLESLGKFIVINSIIFVCMGYSLGLIILSTNNNFSTINFYLSQKSLLLKNVSLK